MPRESQRENSLTSLVCLVNSNVYVSKDAKSINYPINCSYWIMKLAKDIFKWIYAISLFQEDKVLFCLLFIAPFFKFFFISTYALKRFKVNFRGNKILIIIIILILLIESFYELPVHFIFPVNRIYLHTNYYRIYDITKNASTNIYIELCESTVLMVYLIWYFAFGKFHYSAVVLIIINVFNLFFFIFSFLYFCFFQTKHEMDEKEKETKLKNKIKEAINSKDEEKRFFDLKEQEVKVVGGRQETISSKAQIM